MNTQSLDKFVQIPGTRKDRSPAPAPAVPTRRHTRQTSRMHDDDKHELLQRLRTNDTTLTTLNLGYRGLGEVGGAAVAGALERNTTLMTLDLEANGLGEGGGAAVAGLLERNTTLTTLNLEDNGVDGDTMERGDLLLSGREAAAGSGGVEVVCVKAAVAAPPRGTKRDAPG